MKQKGVVRLYVGDCYEDATGRGWCPAEVLQCSSVVLSGFAVPSAELDAVRAACDESGFSVEEV